MESDQLLSTPVSKPRNCLHKVMATTPAGLESPAVRIPPTPFLKRLGYGTGVDVFLYERSPAKGTVCSPWALKRIQKRRVDADIVSRLDEEASILKCLNHPNIIGYRGYKTQENGTKVLAMESGQESLMGIIEERKESELPEHFSAEDIEKVIIALAKALHYLHTEKHLLHGDIKSGNVLIKNDFREIKLCDFGVTVPLDKDLKAVKGYEYVGTDLWSAPEVLDGADFSNKADIFSLGLVVYEMLALEFPHMSIDEDSDASLVSEESFTSHLGTRPGLPEDFDYNDSYKRVIEIYFATTHENPSIRPSAKDIVDYFEN